MTLGPIQLRDVAQTLYARRQFNEDPEIRDIGHLAGYLVADSMRVGVLLPLVGEKFLHRQGDPLVRDVHSGHNRIDILAFLHNLGRMADTPGPGHVRNMNQTIHSGNDLNECAEVGQIPDDPLDPAADMVGIGNGFPGIGLGRPQGQGQTPLLGINLRYDDIDFLTDFNHRARILDLLCPRHLADMNQTLDTLFQSDEGSIVNYADNLAGYAFPNRVLLRNHDPGIFETLLVSQ